MNDKKPRVSIGLPVLNGENYLREAIDSILSQTFQDFEVIISDNASTDKTPEICHEYSKIDKRIKYYRNKRNIGASNNFNQVFKLSSGKYFKWMAHDDVIAPNYLRECVDTLDNDSSIILCHPKIKIIDKNGIILGEYYFGPIFDSTKRNERFGYFITERFERTIFIFGLIRADLLRSTSLFGNYIGADRKLLAEISLLGRCVVTNNFLFFRRSHPDAFSEKRNLSKKEALTWWTTERRDNFPQIKLFFEFFRSIQRIPMKRYERYLCYAQNVKWFFKEGWFYIACDVLENLIGLKYQEKFLRLLARHAPVKFWKFTRARALINKVENSRAHDI